ncbi:hypothetical protein AM501_24050 [Aneurinibacillus migulanus]|uniref:PD-(D/E)XK nuclease family protein n=1 Tax=Aneurinibacillus migulanus TaxID=47500 RepID=UPI0005BAD96D|nr:PD-(D/E)XK nuclease family protein [Aneurinibacillus migulanus]KIV58918.1 hypothetical protein TS64_03930 [Aneurinibacillus migulanus]KPD05850.1 hypothetical protein AM501_24050 [Aneurinibacillus migulanus]
MPEEKIYSFSRLKLFHDCPRAFYHKYIERRPTPSGIPATIGKIFHFAMKLVIEQGYSPEEAIFFSIYEATGLPEGEKAENLTKMVKRAYYRVRSLTQFEEQVDIFSEMHIKIQINKERYVQGFLDIVIDNPATDELLIIDFKSSWSPFPAFESQQLPVYGYLFKMMRNGVVSGTMKGRLIFPRCSEDKDSEIIFTEETLNRAEVFLIETIEQVEALNPNVMDEWNMTNNKKHCEYCPFVSLCAGGFVEGLPSDGVPKDATEAIQIGEYLHLQSRILKNMKNGLKSFVQKNGPVSVSGGQWKQVLGEKKPKVPKNILIEFAKKQEMNITDVLKSDNTTLKKWIEEDETGFLKSHVSWTNPRNNFLFVEDKDSKAEKV